MVLIQSNLLVFFSDENDDQPPEVDTEGPQLSATPTIQSHSPSPATDGKAYFHPLFP